MIHNRTTSVFMYKYMFEICTSDESVTLHVCMCVNVFDCVTVCVCVLEVLFLVVLYAYMYVYSPPSSSSFLLPTADFGIAAQLTQTLVKRKSFIGTPYW